jgi:3-hydroxy-5-methyl-1-naphthoate 3-O-methyltransferase
MAYTTNGFDQLGHFHRGRKRLRIEPGDKMNTLAMNTPRETQQQVTPQRIMQMGWSFALPIAIESAVNNHIFDVLDSGPKTLEDICQQTGCSLRGTGPLMHLLVAIDLLSKETDGKYALTPESSTFLVSTKASFQGSIFHHFTKNIMPHFLSLEEVVRSGKPVQRVNTQAGGAAFYKQFVEDIMPANFPAARAVAQHLSVDLKKTVRRVLDIAAGSGVWGIAMAQAFPDAQLTAVDFPEVLEITRSMAQKFGLNDRYQEVGGDLLEVNFGKDYSVVLLGHILHSQGEEHSRALLQATYRALEIGGTLVIAEFLLNEDRISPTQTVIFNLNMLVNTESGRVYSFSELRNWLTEYGFHNIRTLEAPAPSPLILAEK